MDEFNIETRPFFVPLHATEAYHEAGGKTSCPMSVQVGNRGIVLPTHAGMSVGNVTHVVESLGTVLS